jgi:hypothetical protein
MALPEYSRLEAVPAHVRTDVCVYSKEDERAMVEAEMQYALSAACAAVAAAEGTLSYTAAREAARALHLLDAHARPSCRPSVSDSIWESCPQAIDVLVSKDALFLEAQRWFESVVQLCDCADRLRTSFVAWWALRVGAEHGRPMRGRFPSARCQAIWVGSRAYYQHWQV